jgi:Mn-dependent DtxR family transcriptional regulator
MAAKTTPDEKKVLKALKDIAAPATNKQIATAANLSGKNVTAAMKTLKEAGYVDSPARCKYGLTPSGKKAV